MNKDKLVRITEFLWDSEIENFASRVRTSCAWYFDNHYKDSEIFDLKIAREVILATVQQNPECIYFNEETFDYQFEMFFGFMLAE